jgi:hypothetical protein
MKNYYLVPSNCCMGKFYTILASVADPGCLSRIPDPTFFHPGSELSPSRIIKEFKYFNPKKSKKMVSKL